MLGQPIGIIKQVFVELAGGKLQDEIQHQAIEDKVDRQLNLQGISSEALNIGKTGSSYLVIISLSLSYLAEHDNSRTIGLKESLTAELTDELTFVHVELLPV